MQMPHCEARTGAHNSARLTGSANKVCGLAHSVRNLGSKFWQLVWVNVVCVAFIAEDATKLKPSHARDVECYTGCWFTPCDAGTVHTNIHLNHYWQRHTTGFSERPKWFGCREIVQSHNESLISNHRAQRIELVWPHGRVSQEDRSDTNSPEDEGFLGLRHRHADSTSRQLPTCDLHRLVRLDMRPQS